MKHKTEDQPPDYGPDEARRHAHWVFEQPDPRDRSTRRVRVEQDMPDWYLRRGYIDTHEADALKRWHADAYLAGLLPACVGSYQQAISGATGDLSNTRLAAQARRDHAMATLMTLHRHAVQLVDAVALSGISAGRWMMQHNGGSPNEALNLLRHASTALAKHYGFRT
ncbi:MAG: hypothetical protein ACK52K_15700 [Alphaproteobacteria bacterium]